MLVDPFDKIPTVLRGGVVAIGNFEGVHRGHCRLLARLRERARQLGGPAVAVSFDPHPLRLLRPDSIFSSLVWTERKEEILLASGADQVAILRTSKPFLDLSADTFFHQIIRDGFHARGMVEGRNFFYGKGRAGNVQILGEECRQANMTFDVVDIVTGEGESEISSSRIRREIQAGHLHKAAELLGRPHRVKGRVITGDRRGNTIGFPTANLADVPVLLPREGVYAGRSVIDGKAYPAACNIGPNPTFGVTQQKFEAHLVGFEGDLYGREIAIDLVAHLRDVRPFSGIEALVEQLRQDVAKTVQVANEWHHPYGCDLGQTITEWLRFELKTEIHSNVIEIHSAQLDDKGALQVQVSPSREMLPSIKFELLFRIEERLRAIFPEVRELRWHHVPH